jgi:ABC-2 type transport system ATP-binding protein
MPLAIETAQLTRDFGTFRAVNNLSLGVEAGRFYGFLGPNGAGKSTTIKMLTGLLAPTGGTIRILGRDIGDPAQALEAKRHIGVVPENLALFDNLTAREHLTFIGRMYELPAATIQERATELLAMMELDRDGKKLTMEFSHGMRKKLALAAALIPNPVLLFLDEPFEGVDAVASRVLRETLRRVVERGATVFLTSHVLEIVERSSAPTSGSSPTASWCTRGRSPRWAEPWRTSSSRWSAPARRRPRNSAGWRVD